MCCFSIASAPAGFLAWLFTPKVHVSKTLHAKLPNEDVWIAAT